MRAERPIRAEVKWFDANRGYGFLSSFSEDPDVKPEDYFVHYSAIQGSARMEAWCGICKAWFLDTREECPRCRGRLQKRPYRFLAELQEVEILEWRDTEKGLQATKVRKL